MRGLSRRWIGGKRRKKPHPGRRHPRRRSGRDELEALAGEAAGCETVEVTGTTMFLMLAPVVILLIWAVVIVVTDIQKKRDGGKK